MYCIVKLINKILNNYSSSFIKTIQLDQESSGHQYEQSLNSPLLKSKGVTAAMRLWRQRQVYQTKLQSINPNTKMSKTSSKKVKKMPKLIRAMLDSGSDKDLLFHQHGTPKCFPYLTRQVPKSWCTSNGNFHTEGRGKLEIKFFEFGNSKEGGMCIQPDIVE